jgi:hypothetical protein
MLKVGKIDPIDMSLRHNDSLADGDKLDRSSSERIAGGEGMSHHVHDVNGPARAYRSVAGSARHRWRRNQLVVGEGALHDRSEQPHLREADQSSRTAAITQGGQPQDPVHRDPFTPLSVSALHGLYTDLNGPDREACSALS